MLSEWHVPRLTRSSSQETPFFVRDDVTFAGATVHDFLVGNISVGDPLPGDGYVRFPNSRQMRVGGASVGF